MRKKRISDKSVEANKTAHERLFGDSNRNKFKNYGIYSKVILSCDYLSDVEQKVVTCVIDHTLMKNSDGKTTYSAYPSQERVGRIIGKTADTTQDVFKNLKKKSVLDWEKLAAQKGNNNNYILLVPDAILQYYELKNEFMEYLDKTEKERGKEAISDTDNMFQNMVSAASKSSNIKQFEQVIEVIRIVFQEKLFEDKDGRIEKKLSGIVGKPIRKKGKKKNRPKID